MTTTQKYVTTAEAASHFNVSPATISMMVKSGDIPTGTYLRLGRVFRFDLARVEDGQLAFDFGQDVAGEATHNDGE